jgi:hypothetical protein
MGLGDPDMAVVKSSFAKGRLRVKEALKESLRPNLFLPVPRFSCQAYTLATYVSPRCSSGTLLPTLQSSARTFSVSTSLSLLLCRDGCVLLSWLSLASPIYQYRPYLGQLFRSENLVSTQFPFPRSQRHTLASLLLSVPEICCRELLW